MKKRICLWLLPLLLLSSGGCAKIKVTTPDGFAELAGRPEYRAISPEGVTYKVRLIPNYPPKELDFWGRALKKHLADEGYRFLGEASFTAAGGEGLSFEWGAPYGNEDYIYLTAILVKDKKIAIAEAAGEYKLFGRYREALKASLASLTIH